MRHFFDTDNIANYLIEASKNMDILDCDDVVNASFESLEETLYKLSVHAEYNSDIKNLLYILEYIAEKNN